ncbi:MAG TPA: ArsA family ATPase [Thermoanaerobaculia bacterium]|nr:ArsA family ATPase [Thermoanaerobaculia bacterium]
MSLFERSWILVTGKGGVGKTSVASALARFAADRGRRVLLLESDPRESAHELLGVPPSGGEAVDAGGGLRLLDLPLERAADRVIGERLGLPALARRLRESELYRHFVDGCPGLGELALLETARQALRGDGGLARCDLVVLDAPATGHGLGLVQAPALVAGAVAEGPIGEAAQRLAEALRAPDHTAVVCVTLAEEMSVGESLELRASLAADPGIAIEGLVVNGLLPPVARPRAFARLRAAEPAVELWIQRRATQERQLRRLDTEWEGRRVELPLVAARGAALIRELAPRIAAGLSNRRRR